MNKKTLCVLLCLVLSVFMMALASCDAETNDKGTAASTEAVDTPNSVNTGDTASVTDEETGTPESSTPVMPPDSSTPPSSESTPPATESTPPPTTEKPEQGYQPIDPEVLSAAQKEAYKWTSAALSSAEKGETLSASDDTKQLAKDWKKVYKVISNEMLRIYDEFTDGKISYGTLECFMKSCSNIANAKGLSEGYLTLAKSKRTDIEQYAEAKKLADKDNYKKATMALSKIDKNDFTAQANAKALINANLDKVKAGVTEAITEYMVRYEIAAGKAYIDALRGYGIDAHLDTEAKRLEDYRKFQEEGLVKVNLRDTLENIYTHCLIAFPEINFETKYTYSACGTDCLTPYEFKFLLQSLYDRGYIIIDANLVYNKEDDCPNYSMMLPEGKKPVIFTFDDVTYDSRKMGRGMIDKLIVDEFGYVCTYTKHKDGQEVISYDNELFPILDAFVREHPDFTFRGARGTLFFTGFDGICGYRTQPEPIDEAEAALKLDRQAEIAGAKVVIEALREEGWNFGSHGLNHSHMAKISPSTFRWEIDTWREEVGAIVGDTGLFCWPYGEWSRGSVNLRNNAEHKYLFDSGFYFMFGCGSARYLANEPDGYGIFSDRKGVTGQALLYIAAEYTSYVRDYSYLFDTEKIWDPLRLPYKDLLLSTV